MEAELVNAPVRARPVDPSAMRDEEAEAYPAGRTTIETGGVVDPPPEDDPVREMTPLERVARSELSGG